MSENKNMELNDDMMENVNGGEGQNKKQIEPGIVIGPYDDYTNRKFSVKLDCGVEVVAECYLDGLLLKPGTRVKVAFMCNRWRIIELI